MPGLKLSTALGLQPGLAVFERDAARETSALEELACWAGSLTPTVSLSAPNSLLLEIGGCLRLFGGVEAMVANACEACAMLRYTLAWAVAPTPLGALWLARDGRGGICCELPALHAVLAELPCGVPDWPAEVQDKLAAFGLRRLGDLRAMPAVALRRRLGEAVLDDLARAWGELPQPLKHFVFPENFARKIELPARVEHAEALAFAGLRLFAALTGWLQGRQLLVRACTLRLTHDDGATTDLPLCFAEPAADEARFARLLREHLARLQLAGPVEVLTLLADQVVARPGESAALFERASAGEGVVRCLERLQARLGADAVRLLALKPDYRPECATPSCSFGTALPATVEQPPASGPARPLWLLPVPQALREQGGRPYWHGPLKLQSGAERLESGWWDTGEAAAPGDLRRDYFVASNPLGQWAWIFRDREGWFLHGLFA